MRKLNNKLNWRGFKGDMIGDIVQRKLRSDYSVRDKLDCPKSTNKSVNYRQIWTRFCFLANASINDYKSTYELVGDECIKTDILQDYIEHLDKDNRLPQIKLSAIQMLFDEYVFDIGSELKTRLCHALVAAECGICGTLAQQDLEVTVTESQGKGGKGDPIRYKIEKTADN